MPATNSPNPHGISFDSWGYHFATDGTGGRAFQVRPDGDGFKMHELLKKEVRPVEDVIAKLFERLLPVERSLVQRNAVAREVTVILVQDALNEVAKEDFDKKKLPKRRLCRGHMVDRAIATRDMFVREEPIPLNDFIDKVLQNDCTVIMLDEQNHAPFPDDFIPTDNPNAELFPNGHAGWDHLKQERDYLRQLHAGEGSTGGDD